MTADLSPVWARLVNVEVEHGQPVLDHDGLPTLMPDADQFTDRSLLVPLRLFADPALREAVVARFDAALAEGMELGVLPPEYPADHTRRLCREVTPAVLEQLAHELRARAGVAA